MKRPSLLSQILALNLLMVTAGIFVASVASGLDLTIAGQRWQFLILAMALVLTFLLNTLLLRRRFEPLERLLAMMERVDLSRPGRRLELDTEMPGVSTDIQRLAATFNRMLKRIARDLHDEVNQALTALLLRIEALVQEAPPALHAELGETKRIANQAMGELLDLARQLRPTALDDHGLVAALRTHVREQDRRGTASVHFWADPTLGNLPADVQVVVYRVAQEALVNAARHSGATRIEVALENHGPIVSLLVSDNGSGFAFAAEEKGLGLSGMRERALLVGGGLEIDSRPGKGTTVKLEVPMRSEQPDMAEKTATAGVHGAGAP
jgi:two-component system sensor histidine kinase UhpB